MPKATLPASATAAAATPVAETAAETAADDATLTWATTEFAAATLGDPRRTARLRDLAETLARTPSASLPMACRDTAQLEAAYRFFANDAISPEAMLQSHDDATLARVAQVPLVLAVQDTTTLDFSGRPATGGLGPLRGIHQQGGYAHSTLTLTPDPLVLGLLQQQRWARETATYAKLPDRHQRPISEKESHKWLLSLAAVNAAARRCPATRFVCVGDREADIYDLFVAARQPQVELLVRARLDRAVRDGEAPRLRAHLAAQPVLTTTTVAVPRRKTQPARTATVTVRASVVTLAPPQRRAGERLPPVALWVVWVHERDAPADAEPLDWLLLTTVPVRTADDALERVAWYRCRWLIELWHKVRKSGLRTEERQLRRWAALERWLALASVIAWRLLSATLLARAVPDVPCTVLLEREEWEALCVAIQKTPTPPATPPCLREAVRLIARLGGFLGRKGDGEPGMQTLWRGWTRLADLTEMYRIMKPSGSDSL